MKKPRSLWLFGDSFSHQWTENNKCANVERTWSNQLAAAFSNVSRCSIVVNNFSIYGSSQDYTLSQIKDHLTEIDPSDWVVITLTERSRYWLVDNHPSVSHSRIKGRTLDDPEYQRAIELFDRYINRDSIQILHQDYRLAWLNLIARNFNLNIQVLRCFEDDKLDPEKYTDIKISQGCLLKIQNNEWKDQSVEPHLQLIEFWAGWDARYNHLCLRNHTILAEKLVDAFVKRSAVDLDSGFHRRFLERNNFKNIDWVGEELDPWAVRQLCDYIEQRTKVTKQENQELDEVKKQIKQLLI